MEKSVFAAEYAALIKALIEGRKAQGVRQAELGTLLGRDQSFVSKYERRIRRLDVLEFFAVCRALQIDPHELLKRFLS